MTPRLPSPTVLRWAAVGALVLVGGAVLLWDTGAPGADGSGSLPAAAPLSVTPGSTDGSAATVPTPTSSAATPADTPTASAPATAPTPPATTGRVPTAAPTVVPTEAGPPLPPDAAIGLTVTAADALVRFWYLEAQNYLKVTGDGSAVTRWSDPGCRPCQSVVRTFATSNAANGLLTGDYAWRVDVREVRLTGARSAVVDVDVSAGRHAMAPKRGAALTSFAGGTVPVKVSLIAEGNTWLIFSVEGR